MISHSLIYTTNDKFLKTKKPEYLRAIKLPDTPAFSKKYFNLFLRTTQKTAPFLKISSDSKKGAEKQLYIRILIVRHRSLWAKMGGGINCVQKVRVHILSQYFKLFSQNNPHITINAHLCPNFYSSASKVSTKNGRGTRT